MSHADSLGKLVLRIALGLLILLHGISKVMHGTGAINGMVASAGLPPMFGYLVYVGEIVAPMLVLLGIWARLGGLIIAVNMIVAIILVHQSQLLSLNKQGGWSLELQGMFLFGALAVALLGAGKYAMGKPGRLN